MFIEANWSYWLKKTNGSCMVIYSTNNYTVLFIQERKKKYDRYNVIVLEKGSINFISFLLSSKEKKN